jgi:L-threonylcarbamoyladenylate synthase
MSSVQVARAARVLKAGGVVLHATEGVWGLACDPFDLEAVSRVLVLKGRPVAKGLILVGGSSGHFSEELDMLEPRARAQVEDTWPGAVTWVLPSARFPEWISGGRDTVAVRVSGHPQVRALCDRFGGPLVSTSANPTGRAPATSQIRARAGFHGRVDYILPGEVLKAGAPSRIQTLDGRVLRGGGQ